VSAALPDRTPTRTATGAPSELTTRCSTLDDGARLSPLARVLVGLVRLYQLTARLRAPRCRFLPTCSAYAVECLTVHGAARGGWLALRRLGRCHPWHAGGFDPVPPRK
jgi:putative membrane protein insertion efficiency factor